MKNKPGEEMKNIGAHSTTGKLRFLITFAGCFAMALFLFSSELHAAQIYKITAYCACKKCCGENAKGITASGKKVKTGMVACNHLPFGTQIKIGNQIFTVEDRGAKSYFGTKKKIIRHIDVFIPNHEAARQFGVKYLPTEILA